MSALHSLERDGLLKRSALIKALEKPFGYTSDESGNRRPLIFSTDAGLAGSRFMFGACASLSAYAVQKYGQIESCVQHLAELRCAVPRRFSLMGANPAQ